MILHKILFRFDCLGDIRGCGLLQSVEIVNNKQERIPAANLAAEIMYGMKAKNILIQITGRNQNVILITPPMCFNIENSRMFVQTLEEVLNVLGQEHVRETSDSEPVKIGSKRSHFHLDREDPEPHRKNTASEEEDDEYDTLCDMD